MSNIIEARQAKQKRELVEQLKNSPIVQVACQKVGIARATYYRWRNIDEQFKKDTDEAIDDGLKLVNDLAESQLISAIRDKNMTAIMFWLRSHHQKYSNKLEVSANVKQTIESLSPEQEKLVRKALALASFDRYESKDQEEINK